MASNTTTTLAYYSSWNGRVGDWEGGMVSTTTTATTTTTLAYYFRYNVRV
jgi:hypothetical protein